MSRRRGWAAGGRKGASREVETAETVKTVVVVVLRDEVGGDAEGEGKRVAELLFSGARERLKSWAMRDSEKRNKAEKVMIVTRKRGLTLFMADWLAVFRKDRAVLSY